tara:strand:+ start:94 stop:534 length:441 start_codon:yes stop_codon:yes gene_type:complete
MIMVMLGLRGQVVIKKLTGVYLLSIHAIPVNNVSFPGLEKCVGEMTPSMKNGALKSPTNSVTCVPMIQIVNRRAHSLTVDVSQEKGNGSGTTLDMDIRESTHYVIMRLQTKDIRQVVGITAHLTLTIRWLHVTTVRISHPIWTIWN